MPVACAWIPAFPPDPARWSAALDVLDAASPLVEDGGPGLAFLAMDGIDGGPIGVPASAGTEARTDVRALSAGWLAAVRGALTDIGLPLRLGLGPNRFVARAAATLGDGTVCTGDPAAFVAPLSLELLDDCGADVRARLGMLGIRTLGELAALPHGPFVRRFGPAAVRWHERARGTDRRPLRPRPRALHIERKRYGEGAANSEEAVLFALRALVGAVVDDLGAAGKRAGRLVLTLECENGDTRELSTRVAQPTAVPTTLFALLRARLEGVTLDAPVAGLRLVVAELEGGGVPVALFTGSDPDPDALAVVLARLDAALGEGRALRPCLVAGPRIERRYALEPFTLEALATRTWPASTPSPLPATAALQLRLVDPQPVAVHVAAGAPRLLGTPAQRVVAFAGPWRTDETWWTPRLGSGQARATGGGTPLARDEYDVMLDDGALLRIAREGSAWTLRGIYD